MSTSQLNFIYLICLATCFANDCDNDVPENLAFKVMGSELAFPCASTKHIYKSSGRYIPKNILATRIQIHKEDVFLCLPRFRPGVSFTVAKFSLKSKSCKVQLKPYPCLCSQEEGNCDAFQNAVDLVVDSKERLWILDSGVCNTLEHPVRRCPPKLWGIDIATGKIIDVISLKHFVTSESRLQFLVIDSSSKGVSFAYISDAATGAIIVINIHLGSGYRVILPSVVSADCRVKDILYIQLAHKSTGNILYVNYLSSPRLFSIKSELLQRARTADAVIDVGVKPPGHSMVFLGSNNGTALFFRYKGQANIYAWNSTTPFKPNNFVLLQEGEECRLPTQVVVGSRKLVWAIESNFHDYIDDSTGCFGPSVVVYPLARTDG